jgi:hypothetical protein
MERWEMKKTALKGIIENTRSVLAVCLMSAKLRLDESAFTREDRGLGARKTLEIILKRPYKTLQLEIDDYFKEIGESPVTRQAFSKSRALLNPEFVRMFFDNGAEIIVKEDDEPTLYKNMRLIAIDGSTLAMENTAELRREFGVSGNGDGVATARCSIAFDPLNKVLYDGQIDRYDIGERELAKRHVERLNRLGLRGGLLIFDRGYPSLEFMAFLIDNGYHFVMRVREKWNCDVDEVQTQDEFVFERLFKEYGFRAITVTLKNGVTETLLTSLNQKQLPRSRAAALYFKRWGVEGEYDLLKIRLQLENFSGKSKTTALQDFYATLYVGNLIALSAACADDVVAEKDEGKTLKHPRRSDRGRSVSKFRAAFIQILLQDDEDALNAMLDDLVADIARYPVSIVPNRSVPRKPPRNKRFHQNRKSVV